MVYDHAATVARLRQSAVVALENLAALTDIQGVLVDLERSWDDVDTLVDQISDADFRLILN